MDRRTFLKTSTATAAVTTTTAGAANAGLTESAPAVAQKRHELRIAAPSEPHLRTTAEIFSREIEVATSGSIVMHLTETSGSVRAALQRNDIDGAVGHLPEMLAAPELSLFSGLPGDMALAPELLMTWLSAGAGDLFLEEAVDVDYDVTALTLGHGGAATGLWSDRALNSSSDVAYANVKTIGLGAEIVRALRAGVAHATSDARPANLLETSAQPIQAFADLPDMPQRFWYRDGFHRQGSATSLILSNAAWHKLPPSHQLLTKTFAFAAAQHDLAGVSANNRLVTPAIMDSLPLEIGSLPTNLDRAITQAATQVTHDVMARNAITERAFQAYGTFFMAMTGKPLSQPESRVSNTLS